MVLSSTVALFAVEDLVALELVLNDHINNGSTELIGPLPVQGNKSLQKIVKFLFI